MRRLSAGAASAVALAIILSGCGGAEEQPDLGIGPSVSANESDTPSPLPETPTPTSTPTLPPDQQAAFDQAANAYRESVRVAAEMFARGVLDDYATEQLRQVAFDPLLQNTRVAIANFATLGNTYGGQAAVVDVQAETVDLAADPNVVTLIACLDPSGLIITRPDGSVIEQGPPGRVRVLIYRDEDAPNGWRTGDVQTVEGPEGQC